MSVVLVNGDGNPAVHASQDADLLGGIGGQETGILDINDKFAATIADANTVEISSGVCITKEGRRIQIDVGDVEEVIVPTGSQGTTKYYIIGFHLYTDGSGNQLAETFIDEVESSTATINEKMFKDGETEVYVSLYRIMRNGLNLEGLTLILPEIGSLAGGGIIGNTDISDIADGTLTGAVAQINTDLSDVLSFDNLELIKSFTIQGQTDTFNADDYKCLYAVGQTNNSTNGPIGSPAIVPLKYIKNGVLNCISTSAYAGAYAYYAKCTASYSAGIVTLNCTDFYVTGFAGMSFDIYGVK